ncbi:MAG: tetraacyldisaccharide 4'-kinase [Prevotella sp.]|nr:tetraacyldisaccharide 4'-kinase [Prevotella sp.]
MEGDFIKIRESLIPLSWLYGAAVNIRNFCFDIGLLKSQAFHVPVIAVGNITVGGTGKTPHVEYLVRLLKDKFNVAVLSRGYKRKTNGYLLADTNTTVYDIGDEPYQLKRKFPNISVAVDRKRVHGIRQLTEDNEDIDVIFLDDAYQHRYVKPGVNILLVDYHRLIIYDKLLPAGRLREPLKGKNRADIVIVTKCPKKLKPMEFRVLRKALDLYPYQHLYFTTLDYDQPYGVFNGQSLQLAAAQSNNVLLISGIASPRQLQEDIESTLGDSCRLELLTFSDHHRFRSKDVERINETFAAMPSPRIIITTEKDAVRLSAVDGLSEDVRQALYALPIRIRFMQDEQAENFDQFIKSYVVKNSRNSILVKGKKKEKPAISENSSKRSNTISFK